MGIINGAKIAELRERKGWKQKDLAQAAGVTPSVISRIEKGLQSDFKVEVLVKIANALGVSADLLLDRAYQPETGDLVVELQEAVAQVSKQPKSVQRQVAGMIRGFLSSLADI